MATTTQIVIPPDDPLPDPPDRTLVAPDKIAADLMAAILANGTLAATYTVARFGSTLYITKNSGDFVPYIADTLDNTGMSVVKGTVAGADELPEHAPEGYRLRVSGDPATAIDDYWMVFSGGRWIESAAPGTLPTLDKTTMPWVLSSSGSGGGRTFSFGPVDWVDRSAGDDTSNPLPPLDGIDTLFTTEGRLGFTAGGNVVLSASNAPRQLFRASVAQLLPSDPVSVRSTLGNVGRYHAVVEWDGAAQMWSHEVQRAVYGEPAITPSSIVIAPTSAFANDAECPPIVVGSRIYFARHVDGAIRVFEYSRPPGYDSLPEVRDLTDVVPSYLAGEAKALVADEALGFLAVVLKTPSSTLYVCHMVQGRDGTVPVWHRWTFSGTVVGARMLNDQLLVLLNRSGALHADVLDVSNAADTASASVVDAGGTTVAPSVVFGTIYYKTQNGVPDPTSRITARNLTLFHQNTRAGTLRLTDETTDRVTVTAPIPATPVRVPVMRVLGSFGFTLGWIGFLTNIELQGSIVTRSRQA